MYVWNESSLSLAIRWSFDMLFLLNLENDLELIPLKHDSYDCINNWHFWRLKPAARNHAWPYKNTLYPSINLIASNLGSPTNKFTSTFFNFSCLLFLKSWSTPTHPFLLSAYSLGLISLRSVEVKLIGTEQIINILGQQIHTKMAC